MYEPIQLSQCLNINGFFVTGSVAIIDTILISGYQVHGMQHQGPKNHSNLSVTSTSIVSY